MNAYVVPVAPLIAAASEATKENHYDPKYRTLRKTQAMADWLGITRRHVSRIKLQKHISLDTAEKFADRIGCHPVEIWPNYYELVEIDQRSREEHACGLCNEHGSWYKRDMNEQKMSA